MVELQQEMGIQVSLLIVGLIHVTRTQYYWAFFETFCAGK